MRYLEIVEKSNLIPNFWLSEEYIKRSGFWEEEKDGIVYITDGNCFIFPPLRSNPDFSNSKTGSLVVTTSSIRFSSSSGSFISIGPGQFSMRAEHFPHSLPIEDLNKLHPGFFIWSDFPGLFPWGFFSEATIKTGLDRNYIYHLNRFDNLSGRKFEVFRKNIRKFPNRYGPTKYLTICEYEKLVGEARARDSLYNTFIKWLEARPEEEIHDADLILSYLQDYWDIEVLIDPGKDIVLGFNIFDWSYFYVNFRFSFCVNIPFLSEYLRYLFFTSGYVRSKASFLGITSVNDGGDLGKSSLAEFKRKLRPYIITEISSWEGGKL